MEQGSLFIATLLKTVTLLPKQVLIADSPSGRDEASGAPFLIQMGSILCKFCAAMTTSVSLSALNMS